MADKDEKEALKGKKKKEDEDEGRGKCVISPEYMKLLTLVTLLISDFDVMFTLLSIRSYSASEGVFILFIFVIVFFFCVYAGGCYLAAKEATKFMLRFKDKVKLNEIKGISMEDLDDALAGRRIFWMGPEYEVCKKRKMSVDALRAATSDAIGPEELDIPSLEIALREAEMSGTSQLRTAGDPKFGAKAIKRATERLIQAKKAQSQMGSTLGRSRSRLGAPSVDDEPDDEPDLAEDDDGPEEDFAAKAFEAEIEAAREAEDANLVKMCELAAMKQLDSYKVDPKLLNKKGKVTDPLRALYMICEAKGILHSYHQASRSFSRRIVKPSHSVPYYRLLEYGWQPSVSHTDFAGILNANALYSFTVGIPQLVFSMVFIVAQVLSPSGREPLPCELDVSSKCNLVDDFGRPTVQSAIIAGSMFLGTVSLVISITNLMVDFPAQLFDLAEKDEESLMFTLQAEAATKTWEDKLAVEVQENVKMMLKSAQFGSNPGMEAPGLVVEDVMKLERSAMEKKVAYIDHYLTMSEDEKKLRGDLQDGKRKKKEDDDDDEFKDDATPASPIRAPSRGPSALPRQPSALPPPRQPSALPPPRAPSQQGSLAAIPEPTPVADRVPSRLPSAGGIPAGASAGALPSGASAAALGAGASASAIQPPAGLSAGNLSASALPEEPADIGVDPNAPV